mgnify:CR=1 FL=1
MKDISDDFQRSYGRVCRGGLDVFESADTIETAQRINAMQLLVILWINGWTSESTAALLIPHLAPVLLTKLTSTRSRDGQKSRSGHQLKSLQPRLRQRTDEQLRRTRSSGA